MSNRSLDDFAGGPDDDDDAVESVSDDSVESVSDDTVESVPDDTETEADRDALDTLATYRWTPDGTACPVCGDTVQKRWLDGEQYVCHDCKDW
ncbi:hypothetical protein C453_17594 [Haloferax elongans ATCC BAA-1513]|uniref:DUF7573 domain-containing protein n=1 Tax=Haloferax elongans ATCC BAA-1513 TaxID=1230453 RepID=M0HDG8_HALEO|nr:hypothetical protein [Haloferax elongans]ELZ81853.1 hypothetical protein C453_17594 [Haloferax elongans ATCC BAA-1513]